MFASKFLTAIICYTTYHVDRSSLCQTHTRLVGAVIDSYWWKCFPIGFSSPRVWSVWHPVYVQQHFAATTSSHGNVLIMGRPGECAYHGEAKGRGRVITQGGQGRGWWLTAVLHARQLFPFVCSAISWWLCPKTWAGNDSLLLENQHWNRPRSYQNFRCAFLCGRMMLRDVLTIRSMRLEG